MCNNRIRTRDLLLEYDNHIMPPRPRAAGLGLVYPWENYNTSILEQQLFSIAMATGYTGTAIEFKTHFGEYLQKNEIIFSTLVDFPENGVYNKLYFDVDEKILYHWDRGYKPINTMIIADTIINGGEA